MRKLSFPGKTGKIYALGIFLVCGLLLISAEECEDISMAEQEAAWARYQAAQTDPDQAAAWAQYQASQSGTDQQAAWDQQQASQSQADQQAAWDQQQASQSQANQQAAWDQQQAGQSGQAAGAPPSSGPTASGPTAGGSQAATGPQAGGTPAASGPTASGPSASQTPAGAQGNSGAQGQQQAGTDSPQVAGGGTAGGSASQSGAGTGGTAPAGGNQTPTGTSTGANFLTGISGKDWKLSEVRLQSKTIVLDRAKLNSEGAGDIFTMTVDGNRISGKAAPNRYNTVYQAGENNTLTLSPVVSTLMASSFDPERIQEHEYYQYLSKVKSWRLNQNKLELVTTDASNKEAVLVYVN